MNLRENVKSIQENIGTKHFFLEFCRLYQLKIRWYRRYREQKKKNVDARHIVVKVVKYRL